jgi:hypothetical protein
MKPINNVEKIRLKGGSLSGTYACKNDLGLIFVRKEVSLTEDREYGFQRWYSQLKRLQRYGEMFPGIFPKVMSYGCDEKLAYFDIEFIEDSQTLHEFVCNTNNTQLIDKVFNNLIHVMHKMHKVKIPSFESSFRLYIREEIEQKINECMTNDEFKKFSSYNEIIFNGEKIIGFRKALNEYIKMFELIYKNPSETYTHGNLTLENILYQPKNNKIIFIDPYEENIIDSALAEYSQVLQSSNSLYEIYNEATPVISGREISVSIKIPEGLEYFNKKFKSYMNDALTSDQIRVVRLLEISQFLRMLPFKMKVDKVKMIFFYALASYLFHILKIDLE